MRSTNEIQFVFLQKCINDILPKGITNSSIKVSLPTSRNRIWVCPQHIGDQIAALVFDWPLDAIDSFELFEERAYSSMNAKDPLAYDCCDRQIFKSFSYILPNFYIQFSLAFIIKPIDFAYSFAFMVSPKHKKSFAIFYFVSHHQADALQRFLPSIDVVSKKQIVFITRLTSSGKDIEKILKLAMNIPADHKWWVELQQHWLFKKFQFEEMAQRVHLFFRQCKILTIFFFVFDELLYNCFQVDNFGFFFHLQQVDLNAQKRKFLKRKFLFFFKIDYYIDRRNIVLVLYMEIKLWFFPFLSDISNIYAHYLLCACSFKNNIHNKQVQDNISMIERS